MVEDRGKTQLDASANDKGPRVLRPLDPNRVNRISREGNVLPHVEVTELSTDICLEARVTDLAANPTCNVSETAVAIVSDQMSAPNSARQAHGLEAKLTELRTLCTSFEARETVASGLSDRLEAIEMRLDRLDDLCTSLEAREAVSSDLANRLQAIVVQQQRLNTICNSFETHEAVTSDLTIRLQATDAHQQQLYGSFKALGVVTSDLSNRLQTIEAQQQWPASLDLSLETQESVTSELSDGLQAVEVQQQQLSTSFKAQQAIVSNFSKRLQAVEMQKKQLDSISTSFEVREAVTWDLSQRMQAMEVQAIEVQQEQHVMLRNRLHAIEEATASQQTKLQTDFAALQENQCGLLELKNHVRMQQERQELQAERLVSIVTDLETLFSSTKQELHEGQLKGFEDEFNGFQEWATQQIDNLKAELGEQRSSIGKCMPFGALVREMQSSISEQKHCQDSFREQVQQDVGLLESQMSACCKEKDHLQDEIGPLQISASNLDQTLYLHDPSFCMQRAA